MSILEGVLTEEYDRLQRLISNLEKEREELPRGYISKKIISEKPYYYLQYRENNKIKSEYIPKSKLDTVRKDISLRRELDLRIKEAKKDKKKLERVLG